MCICMSTHSRLKPNRPYTCCLCWAARLNIMSDNEADDIQRHPYSEVLKVMQKLQPHTFTKGDTFENYELHQACPK